MPRSSRRDRRHSRPPAGRSRGADFTTARPTRFSPRPSQDDQLFWQCSRCGAPGDPINGRAEDSYCPHCRATGTVFGEQGKIPYPSLYHAWLQKQQQVREGERLVTELRQRGPTPNIQKGADPVKRKKSHSGTYHCPSCFIEFDLVAEESLKCDTCGGPLAKGTLDDVWADDEIDDDQDDE